MIHVIQKKRNFNNYFSNLIFSKTIAHTDLKLCLLILQTHLEGTVSHIFLIMSWFGFYDRNRKILYKFCTNNFLNNIK